MEKEIGNKKRNKSYRDIDSIDNDDHSVASETSVEQKSAEGQKM